eukprot:TRINITY_DN8368_c0_g2_i1.p1 TRINITY_DN8368_c0_g2~~TRINITY_DN8368_c0_g2_i1.p1  ORF type:complete len:591 (+),score=127.92 TRINITY_DN8368_c0_g2_i1:117-1889(+)
MVSAFTTMALLIPTLTLGCTNILVPPSSSADKSTIVAYNADSDNLYGSLGHYPARSHPAGTIRQIWDWDSSMYLGNISEASHTWNVVGNANEWGVVIGETTFGGLPALDGAGTGAILDYGSLIWVTLQRAKTAREAIKIMDELVQEYGYASDGESFSVADGSEVWLMELIGKGKIKGAVWVASKVPNGMIGATANQARTRTFVQDDPENVLYAHDVVTFAQSQGLYPTTADPKLFSFSDVYDPVSFTGARLAEARVWVLFTLATKPGTMDRYLDYAQGRNLTNRMPLFVQTMRPLSVNDTMNMMRTHFEGTWFDNTGQVRADLGAGSGHSPYRWRPLSWQHGGNKFINERTVGVQQTAWAFVAQSRSWMPAPLKALFWFAPDDSSTAVRIPLYGGATRIPGSYGGQQGQEPGAGVPYAAAGDAYHMDLNSAFWVYNLVANLAYGERYADIYPLIQVEIAKYQAKFFREIQEIDSLATSLWRNGSEAAAVEMATKYCETTGDWMTGQWRQFWMYLFARTRDGLTVLPGKLAQCSPGQTRGCTSRYVPDTEESGYTQDWYGRIVAEDGEHYRVPAAVGELDEWKLRRIQKRR